VKFLVDAQLPAGLARLLTDAGHDSIHTTALPKDNRTHDNQLAALADAEDRVLVTKDRDFRDSHLLKRTPRRLLVVTTGNITNTDLLALVKANLEAIVTSFDDAAFVELGPDRLIVHR
jgi:predicted nuclease of predicted toxin-antitoxin system